MLASAFAAPNARCLLELERNEEVNIVEEPPHSVAEADDVETMLSTLVQRVTAAEHRVGATVFQNAGTCTSRRHDPSSLSWLGTRWRNS